MIAATPVAAPQPAPYQPGAQPQAPYQPIPAQPHAVPSVSSTNPPGSKKALWIVLLLLVVGGGAAAAILLLGGKGGSGGASSRDGLVDQMLAAMNAGDGPALFALAMDESRTDEFMECDGKDKDDEKHKERAERHRKRALEDAGKLAADQKGRGLAVDATTENDESSKHLAVKKGEKLKDCTAKVDVASHDLEVVAHDDKGKKLVVRVQAIEIDGRWFLGREPKIKEAAGAAPDDIKPPAIAATKSASPPPPAPTTPAPLVEAEGSAAIATGSTDGIPQSYVDYQAAMEKLANCDKLPQASRDGMKQGFDMMKQSWAQLKNLPASAQKSIEDACKQGVDAMKQMSALGC